MKSYEEGFLKFISEKVEKGYMAPDRTISILKTRST